MNRFAKSSIGLAAALAVGGIAHGPLGFGEALVGRMESDGQEVVRRLGVPGVTLSMERSPLITRTAILNGPANRFQREGMGSLPGIDGNVRAVPGIARVRWTSEPAT